MLGSRPLPAPSARLPNYQQMWFISICKSLLEMDPQYQDIHHVDDDEHAALTRSGDVVSCRQRRIYLN
jgi:hypothetical protein